MKGSSITKQSLTRVGAALPFFAGAALALALFFGTAAPAFAGQASSGELLYYPCTDCHPVTVVDGKPSASKPLPNDFKGHQIVLEGHDKLGKGNAACLACHDDPSRNPGMLKLADGSLIDIKGDVAQVCYRCHSDKYKQWQEGTHGKRKPSCVAAGCHDPHTPGYIYAPALLPFQGTGFQVQVLPTRVAFKALARPPLPPAVYTPRWFSALTVLGLLVVLFLIGELVLGRSKR